MSEIKTSFELVAIDNGEILLAIDQHEHYEGKKRKRLQMVAAVSLDVAKQLHVQLGELLAEVEMQPPKKEGA